MRAKEVQHGDFQPAHKFQLSVPTELENSKTCSAQVGCNFVPFNLVCNPLLLTCSLQNKFYLDVVSRFLRDGQLSLAYYHVWSYLNI